MPIVDVIRPMYERMFVAFYGWSLRVDGNHGAFNTLYATLMLSLALFTNVASLLLILGMVGGWPSLRDLAAAPKAWWVAFAAVIAGLQFAYFGTNGRVKRLVSLHAGSEGELLLRPRWRVGAYLVLSYGAFVSLLFLGFRVYH